MESTPWFQVKNDLRQASEYGKYIEGIGWILRQVQDKNGKDINIFIRKLGQLGIAKIQRTTQPLPFEEIEQILRREKVFMCKIEPVGKELELKKFDFRQDSWPLLASKTLRVNLTPSLEKILAGFKKDARYCIRKFGMNNAQCTIQINEFEKFYEILKKANKTKNLWTSPEKDYWTLVKAFGKNCFCVTVNNLGGCLVLLHNKTAYYYFSGTLPEGKKINLPYVVVWEAMKEAKKRGAEIWDFDGIYDSRWPNPSWKGFTHFKQSFGGVEVEFPGCFTKWRWPF
jgi:lipid II:glycine glycyltransferase (peptidoglycan interpeptide bridge formation enzyme)